ncbi:MAG: DUF6394 family protein [Propionibacteriaceae bacterium]|nr:DUF6394 family protein [Propionibacteriaceae bacterium]
MNFEKVVFGFFITLALTLNFGFFVGSIDNPAMHNGVELVAALVVSLIATVLKFGDRTQLGAVHLATSLVADLQLIVACILWVVLPVGQDGLLGPGQISVIVSMSGGALVANVISVILMVSEIVQFRR